MRILLLIFAIVLNSYALDATMEIIKDTTKLPYIVVENSNNDSDSSIGSKTYKMLVADLKVSSHFNVIEDSEAQSGIDYTKYSAKNVNLVARIDVKKQDGKLIANLLLYDINIKQNVLNKQYNVSQDSRYPFISHKMAIDINDYIKAPSIEWMNRFVVLSKYTNPQESQIIIADYTLTFQNTVIRGGLNIFPKWADKEQTTIYFTKYYDSPTLVKYNIYTGQINNIISSDGMLIVSDVSVDGNKILVTMAPNNQPDIYLYDIQKRISTKLTNYSGIDVGANFIDNEKSIMFISDRLGYPNIFSLNLSTKLINQLVYHGKNNSSASAFNNYVVYSSRESDNEFGVNTFNLYLISTTSDYIRRLTASGVNQMPKFSRDGGSIMFIKNLENESSLGIIRLDYNKSYLFPLPKEKIQAIDW